MGRLSAMWRPIDTAPKELEQQLAGLGLEFGPWVRVRNEAETAKARWRLPVSRYDIQTDQVIRRNGAWWGEKDRPLQFEPTEWDDL